MADFDELAEKLSLTDIIRLQDTLSRAVVRRFEKKLCLVFSDIVGSTQYFARFGDEAGRRLQQRHVDLLQAVAVQAHGRIVDTAGDGAFLCFPQVVPATKAMVALQEKIGHDNEGRPPEARLLVRIGVHFGPVLTDGVLVSGDAVNFASRVAGTAPPADIHLSMQAYLELQDVLLRLKCHRLAPQTLKGIEKPVELVSLDWLDRSRFPRSVRFDGTEVRLPSLEVIRFGRLREQDGASANDVVLEPTDPAAANRISRWHFELHRKTDGYVLKSVTSAPTEVDGQLVHRGEEVKVSPGATVRVGGVLTMEFLGDQGLSDQTLLPG